MNICLFAPDELGRPLDIRDERAEHILKILKKKVGDSFAAGVIGSSAGTATITAIHISGGRPADGRKAFSQGTLEFSFVPQTDGKPLHPLVMVIGFPRPIQLRRLLRDMASIGVSAVYLTATALGEKSYLKSALAAPDEGYRMLLDGTVQAASTHVPRLHIYGSLAECLDAVEAEGPAERLCLDNVAVSAGLCGYLSRVRPYQDGPHVTVAAIGSERGWTADERTVLERRGYVRLGMGSRVLRTETAATVAASLILGAMGALDSRGAGGV